MRERAPPEPGEREGAPPRGDPVIEPLCAAFRASAWRRPDTTVLDEPDWFETRTPSSRFGNHNCVRRCRLTGSALRQRIRELQAQVTGRGCESRWTVTPECTPGLGDVLVDEGFRAGWRTVGMVRGVEPLDAPPVEVRITEDCERFARVCGLAWDLEASFVRSIAEDMARYLARGSMIYSIATLDGVDVGTSHVLLAPRSGYLMGGAVLPEARGRGIYRAMVSHRLELLRARDIELCTVLAVKETSAPILPRLGFRPVGEFQDYTWAQSST